MLKFLVLGIVPGTSHQLNFAAVLLVLLAVFLVLEIYLRKYILQAFRKRSSEYFGKIG
ncbi:MAG: hypothetical protein M3Q79_03485 [bacterium]|nr:hypothetical protein [bacterium]